MDLNRTQSQDGAGDFCWHPATHPPSIYRLLKHCPSSNSEEDSVSCHPFASELGRRCYEQWLQWKAQTTDEGYESNAHCVLTQQYVNDKPFVRGLVNSQDPKNVYPLLQKNLCSEGGKTHSGETNHSMMDKFAFNRHLDCDFLLED
ncbi:hypothetical protein EG68_02742 [Paragonimus skrjabini miyazakii]|uniref:Uncharacterized protein n=1 Tax=Paragonimus skrjabini miyazakii TaxID=59628 RepID=A0A8S9YYY4_9TREM|nr:hypothetical protein EG68_02742 [Paragonimus skrjabini miyazakii]